MDNRLRASLRRENLSDSDAPCAAGECTFDLATLAGHGISDTWDDELLGARLATKLAARFSPPIAHADVFITEDCNHRCDGTSSFESVMPRLPMMKRYQPWQGSRVTLHPDTIGDLRGDVEYLFAHGINQFIIGPATGIDWPDGCQSPTLPRRSARRRESPGPASSTLAPASVLS